MTGLNLLQNLDEAIKSKLVEEYGSLGKFYQLVFDLWAQDYSAHMSKNQLRQTEIKKSINDLEDKLETFGIIDGSDITNEISSDFGDIIVRKEIQKLDNYLKLHGTDYNTMRAWVQTTYGI